MTGDNNQEHDFEMDLEENAFDSLEVAVNFFLVAKNGEDSGNLKYSILLSVHSVELFLKARLAKAHYSLIFEKPEDCNRPDAKTVDYRSLKARLKSIGVNLNDSDVNTLDQLKRHRNHIEHHRVQFQIEEIEGFLARTYKFLQKFVNDELGIDIKTRIDAETNRALEKALYSYEERRTLAIERAESEMPAGKDRLGVDRVDCPHCGEATIVWPSGSDGTVQCHFCDEKFHAEGCGRCGAPIFYSKVPDENSWQAECNDCEAYRMSKDD